MRDFASQRLGTLLFFCRVRTSLWAVNGRAPDPDNPVNIIVYKVDVSCDALR